MKSIFMKSLSLLIGICLLSSLSAQYPAWENILNTNYTLAIADDDQSVWVGTEYGGLIEVDKTMVIKPITTKPTRP